ncbi:hypothetical protein HYW42_02285 [Candidatus Daviesbacteria bacterium]|nr:hypothetical protein [Candidatus Daviesbacteria bacterium]
MDYAWHTKKVNDIFGILHSNENGLSKEEVKARLEKYGPNKLPDAKIDSLLIIFLRQFQSPLIYTQSRKVRHKIPYLL